MVFSRIVFIFPLVRRKRIVFVMGREKREACQGDTAKNLYLVGKCVVPIGLKVLSTSNIIIVKILLNASCANVVIVVVSHRRIRIE